MLFYKVTFKKPHNYGYGPLLLLNVCTDKLLRDKKSWSDPVKISIIQGGAV